jgi:integrase
MQSVQPTEFRVVVRVKAPTFATLANDYLTKVSAPTHAKDWHVACVRHLTKVLIPVIGHLPADEVTRRQLALIISRIKEEGTPTKANHTLVAARNVFAWAINTGRLDCANPARDLQKPKGKSRDRVLSLEELNLVWQAAGRMKSVANYGGVIRMLILTGARRTEIAELRWDEVGEDAITLPKHRTKNRKGPRDPAVCNRKGVVASET